MSQASPRRRPSDLDRRLHFLLRRVSAAQRAWSLIADGDRVLLGLSGGKDSVTLLHLLLAWRRVAPTRFDLAALHVEQEPTAPPDEAADSASDRASAERATARRHALETLAASLRVELSFVSAPREAPPIAGSADARRGSPPRPARDAGGATRSLAPEGVRASPNDEGFPSPATALTPRRPRTQAGVVAKPAARAGPGGTPGAHPCFRCSWVRREALFRFAAERGFNKVALAHHLDDAAQTVLMNLLFHGGVEGLEPRREFFGGKIVVIRPLILAEEREIRRVASRLDFPFASCDCPHGVDSERARAAAFLATFGRRAGSVKRNLWRAARAAAEGRASTASDDNAGAHR